LGSKTAVTSRGVSNLQTMLSSADFYSSSFLVYLIQIQIKVEW